MAWLFIPNGKILINIKLTLETKQKAVLKINF